MSASDVRRGPGWWMDLDGEWNPPERWPEPTPPLPGWRRDDVGRWVPPTAPDGSIRESTREDEAVQEPVYMPEEEARPRLGLTYAEVTAPPSERMIPHYEPRVRSAVFAALASAVIAAMIATGLVVLVSLF